MEFGSLRHLEIMDAEQLGLVKEFESLRLYAKTAAQREALDLILDQAQETRFRINCRRSRIARMAMMAR